MANLHISISAETIAHVGPLAITNSMLTSVFVSALLVIFAVAAGSALKKQGKPSRFQAFVEMIIESFYKLAEDITGSRSKALKFFPLSMTFFLFIMMNNWFGLLPGVGTIGFLEEPTEHAIVAKDSLIASTAPVSDTQEVVAQDHEQAEGVAPSGEAITQEHEAPTEDAKEEKHAGPKFVPYLRAGTADLNGTIALAIISVVMTQYFGLSALGIPYLSKFFNFSSPITVFIGILELVLEFAKIMSFAFRLFGNVFAGEVLLAVMMALVPVVVPMPFYGLELFVGFIQALVFTMLSLVFFNLATIGHGDEHH